VDVIYGLIPAMIILGLVMVGILVWAVKSGQYDDLEGDANRILMDDDDPLLPDNANKKTVRKITVKKEKTKKNPTERIKQAGKNWPDAD
jgi:cbb3-type cytochrome oxidase maturation protein